MPSIEIFQREKDLLSLKDGQFRAFREFLIGLDPANVEHFTAFDRYMTEISTSQLTNPGSPFPGGCWVDWDSNYKSWIKDEYYGWLYKWGVREGDQYGQHCWKI